MNDFYKIEDTPAAAQNQNRLGHGELSRLIYNLNPGQRFLCRHQGSASLRLIKKTEPSRKYRQTKDKETGGTWIMRIE